MALQVGEVAVALLVRGRGDSLPLGVVAQAVDDVGVDLHVAGRLAEGRIEAVGRAVDVVDDLHRSLFAERGVEVGRGFGVLPATHVEFAEQGFGAAYGQVAIEGAAHAAEHLSVGLADGCLEVGDGLGVERLVGKVFTVHGHLASRRGVRREAVGQQLVGIAGIEMARVAGIGTDDLVPCRAVIFRRGLDGEELFGAGAEVLETVKDAVGLATRRGGVVVAEGFIDEGVGHLRRCQLVGHRAEGHEGGRGGLSGQCLDVGREGAVGEDLAFDGGHHAGSAQVVVRERVGGRLGVVDPFVAAGQGDEGDGRKEDIAEVLHYVCLCHCLESDGE